MAKQFGVGDYRYEYVEGWGPLPRSCIVSDVICDSDDRVYVAIRDVPRPEKMTGAILVYDRGGNLLETWGEDLFTTPHALWINPEDEIFYVDCDDHTVRKCSTSGEILMTIGEKGKTGAPGAPFNRPCQARQSQSGEIYVSDGYGQDRVHRFSSEGELILSWGSTGTGPGEFQLPHSAIVDGNNRVYVIDRTNNRIQLFTTDGEYLSEWADVAAANDAVIDENNVMHIAEGLTGMLLMTLDGEVIGRWGEKGTGPGQFLGALHGLWFDNHGDLYITEVVEQNRLLKFARV